MNKKHRYVVSFVSVFVHILYLWFFDCIVSWLGLSNTNFENCNEFYIKSIFVQKSAIIDRYI
ncbi:hypothetical protein CAL7716_035850 [Calothrix sp. PCC 7716]|nr:hypothetical protein CAL7716_035850 [Calothrix sp. PCC 7716]